AGAVHRGLAVDVHNLIPLTPPAAVIVLDAQDATQEVSAPSGLQHRVGTLRRRRALAVLGVKESLVGHSLAITRLSSKVQGWTDAEEPLIGDSLAIGAVVDLVPMPARLFAHIGYRQTRRPLERHGNVTIPRRSSRGRVGGLARLLVNAQQGRAELLGGRRVVEKKIADGRFH